MLSILIPTYQYNVLPLVKELHQQCSNYKVVFEILVMDDASPELVVDHLQLALLPFCTYLSLDKNIGRAAVRNKLAAKAKYANLLFLDADVWPKDHLFIKRYVNLCNDLANKVYFGGYCYTYKSVNESNSLRYFYGKAREEQLADLRNLNPFAFVFSGNFLVDKECFLALKIPDINVYGMDIYVAYLLQKNKCNVQHINNEIIHLGIEANQLFLKKALVSVAYRKENWLHIPEIVEVNKLLKCYKKLNIPFVNRFMKVAFLVTNQPLKSLFLKPKPYLWAFDLYRLLYLFK